MTDIATPTANHDLKAEAVEARDPRVRFAFEFPKLLRDFEAADLIANSAKRNSRRLGFLSVGLVLTALLIASSSPLLHVLHVGYDTIALLGYASAVIGLLGALLAFYGMHGASPRRLWLRNRLKSEMLRLFHFHYLAARLPALVRASGDAKLEQEYLAHRDQAYAAFLAGPIADPKSELARLAARTDMHDFRVAPTEDITGQEHAETALLATHVWRALRLNWQMGYVEAKLSKSRPGPTISPHQLELRFSAFAWLCVAIILGLHLLMVGNSFLHVSHVWLEVAVVWTALIALAARALEDGLQPQREVERYEQYRANILVASERYDAAEDLAQKLEVIRAFERNSLEEMRIFMRTHARSRYML